MSDLWASLGNINQQTIRYPNSNNQTKNPCAYQANMLGLTKKTGGRNPVLNSVLNPRRNKSG
jgi:hypothetical protein